MRNNNLIWIFVFLLLASLIYAVFASGQPAHSASAAPASTASSLRLPNWQLFQQWWFILFVNSMIVWLVLFVLQSLIIGQKEGKEKGVIWLITLVLAVFIAFAWGGGYQNYIWKTGYVAKFFSVKFLINSAIISLAVWFGFGLLTGKQPSSKAGMVGMVMLTIFITYLLASSIGDKYLWATDNGKAIYEYLLGPEKDIKDLKTGKITGREGGILRPEGKNYRLFVFLGTALMLAWFLPAYLNLQQQSKLTYAIAILLAAILAHKGSPSSTATGMAEIFFLLIIAKQITIGTGTIGSVLSWSISIIITQWIFGALFETTIVGKMLSPVFNFFGNVPIIGSWVAEIGKAIINAPGYLTGTITPPPGGASTTITPPPGGTIDGGALGWLLRKLGIGT